MSARAAIVLAGGGSRRLGGTDKPSVTIGGRSLLDRACAAVRATGIDRIVVVGPDRMAETDVIHAQESPPGAGPAAAVGAGMRALGEVDGDHLILVLACDMPRAASALAGLVDTADRAVTNGFDGAIARADGHDQFLMFAASATALAGALAPLELRDCPMRSVIEALNLARYDITSAEAFDVDTWQAVGEARHHITEGATMEPVNDWIREASSLAEVDAPVDVDAILDLARDAAHGVARPAAPISTFILGYAAGARGLNAAAVAELAAMLGRAAEAHADDDSS